MQLPTERINGLHPARRCALLGLLGAQAILLAFLEGMVPPLPFLPPGGKAGFSNLITMYTCQALGMPSALAVCVIKSFFVLITRGATAFVMSLCGGMTSVLVMGLLMRTGRFGTIGIGISGALCHNAAQLAVASVLMGTKAVFGLVPVLALFSLLTGAVTGALLYGLLPILHAQTAHFLHSG